MKLCRFFRIPGLLCLPVLFCLIGCSKEPEIRTARIPTAAGAASAAPASDVMLAAIVPARANAWFFKLSGSKSHVESVAEQFESLLQSLEIAADGKPVWKTPEKWAEVDISGSRAASFGQVAAFEIPTDGEPLKCTVSQLGAEDPTQDEYQLGNLNRWRGQLGLSPLSIDEFKAQLSTGDDLKQIKLGDGTAVLFARIEGTSSAGGGAPMMGGGGPFAGGAGPANPHGQGPPVGPAGPPGTGSRPTASEPVTQIDGMSFAPASDWKPGKTNQFRAASWQVDDGGDSVEIYITKLPPSDIALNVNRWRGQAGLPELSGEELDKTIEKLDVGGSDCHLTFLNGDKQSVFGAIIARDGVGWFIKLQGSPALAVKQEAAFRAFINSIKFE